MLTRRTLTHPRSARGAQRHLRRSQAELGAARSSRGRRALRCSQAPWWLLCALSASTACSDGNSSSSPALGEQNLAGTAAAGAQAGSSSAGSGAVAGSAAVQAGTGSAQPQAGAGSAGTEAQGSATECEGESAVSAKRVVRLSFNQVAHSIKSLVDPALGAQIVEQFELVDSEHRAFPPLQSPREGNSFTDQSWSSIDQIAQAAGDYVAENLEAVTACGAEPTDDCALSYLTALAERGYRRPLSAEELGRFTSLYTESFRGEGATVAEAIQYGVYAVLQSPHFLYRTEFGDNPETAGPLTPLELASMLSYFLTDDTPDPPLMAAAVNGELSTSEQVGAQVDRLLLSEAARLNLRGAMMSYFSYPNLETQVIQDEAFTGAMRQAMLHEAQLFLERSLWSGPLDALLTSRTGFVNEALAPLYGLTDFPPSGVTPDADSFFEVQLPENRTGLLTQAGFLANRSRPDHTSVVGRGLLIKNAFLCTETPPPSDAILEAINTITAANPNASEREMAELRAAAPACSQCHSSFDAYGLALDTYDVLGRYREVDDQGRPIESSVTLPEEVGGGEAANIVEVAQSLAASGAFGQCMGQNLVNYALADVSAGAATIRSCAVRGVSDAFEKTDGSFMSLIRAVATSAVFNQRLQGGSQ